MFWFEKLFRCTPWFMYCGNCSSFCYTTESFFLPPMQSCFWFCIHIQFQCEMFSSPLAIWAPHTALEVGYTAHSWTCNWVIYVVSISVFVFFFYILNLILGVSKLQSFQAQQNLFIFVFSACLNRKIHITPNKIATFFFLSFHFQSIYSHRGS